jgi:hypothetical protein
MLRDPEQCTGMLGQRREYLLVERARIGDTTGRFVARGKREGILNGELHRRDEDGTIVESGREDGQS